MFLLSSSSKYQNQEILLVIAKIIYILKSPF